MRERLNKQERVGVLVGYARHTLQTFQIRTPQGVDLQQKLDDRISQSNDMLRQIQAHAPLSEFAQAQADSVRRHQKDLAADQILRALEAADVFHQPLLNEKTGELNILYSTTYATPVAERQAHHKPAPIKWDASIATRADSQYEQYDTMRALAEELELDFRDGQYNMDTATQAYGGCVLSKEQLPNPGSRIAQATQELWSARGQRLALRRNPLGSVALQLFPFHNVPEDKTSDNMAAQLRAVQ
ncbi:MAG TPA: hypothetical protein VFL85_00820, partial [Candidatus Saccharimonadales bacterium]|nr:hypothetical protein [Candidatus Saccharimonadales bacterium]